MEEPQPGLGLSSNVDIINGESCGEKKSLSKTINCSNSESSCVLFWTFWAPFVASTMEEALRTYFPRPKSRGSHRLCHIEAKEKLQFMLAADKGTRNLPLFYMSVREDNMLRQGRKVSELQLSTTGPSSSLKLGLAPLRLAGKDICEPVRQILG